MSKPVIPDGKVARFAGGDWSIVDKPAVDPMEKRCKMAHSLQSHFRSHELNGFTVTFEVSTGVDKTKTIDPEEKTDIIGLLTVADAMGVTDPAAVLTADYLFDDDTRADLTLQGAKNLANAYKAEKDGHSQAKTRICAALEAGNMPAQADYEVYDLTAGDFDGMGLT